MGIEHLLSPVFKKEVDAWRARCIQAVLMEQARVGGVSARFGWERIALASVGETKRLERESKEVRQAPSRFCQIETRIETCDSTN